MKSLCLNVILLCALTLAGWAQGQSAEVSAFLSSGVVKLGAPVQLVVVIEGASEGRIKSLPSVPGLRFGGVYGPSVQRFSSSINGRRTVSQKSTWRVELEPSAVGDYEIPSFEVEVEGELVLTRPMSLRVREDMQGAELGYLEFNVRPKTVVDGQPFTVEIVFGWDAGLASRINHANLSLPWWERIAGAIEIEGQRALAGQAVLIDLNGQQRIEVQALGVQARAGRDYQLYKLERHYLATSPGTIEFPQPTLEFARMSQGSLFDNPRAIEQYYKSGAPARLDIGALPDDGRPIEFSGAVGAIEAFADASRREVDAGDSIKVRVTWTGDGNLEFFRLPDLSHAPGFEGFRFYGATDEEKGRYRRVATFDLAPQDSALTAIPPIPLTLFDPELGRYRVVGTEPIPIRVHGLSGSGLEDLSEPEPVDEIHDLMEAWEPSAERASGKVSVGMGAGILGSTLGVLCAAAFLRPRVRRGLDPTMPAERRRARALKQLGRDLRGAPDADARLAAFCAFLAARTRTTADAWHGRRFEPGAFGLERELAVRGDAALDALERAAWAAGGRGPDDAELVALARDLVEGGL